MKQMNLTVYSVANIAAQRETVPGEFTILYNRTKRLLPPKTLNFGWSC